MPRALLRLVLLAALGALVARVVRTRSAAAVPAVPTGPAVWPPHAELAGTTAAAPDREVAAPETDGDPPEPRPLAERDTAAGFAPDTVPARGPVDAGVRWVAAIEGRCPDGYPVKVKVSSGIFHVPGGRFYDRTVPDRCYASPDDAVADGYRAAKA